MRGDLSAGRAGENPEISITHEQLANQINSSREVVSRTLKNMESKYCSTQKRKHHDSEPKRINAAALKY